MAYQGLRRVPVTINAQQKAYPKTLPAATRGIILNENLAFMNPAACLLLQNWFPTQNTLKLRGGSQLWANTGETGPIMRLMEYRNVNGEQSLFASTQTSVYDVTNGNPLSAAVTGQLDGNYSFVQMDNASGNYLIAVNDAGDYAIRFDGTNWIKMSGGMITGPAGTPVAGGQGLTAVWKHGSRLFFIEGGSMNAWCLDINAIQGALSMIPLGGIFNKGGSLLFGANWSVAAGDGMNDMCVFVSTEGEFAVYSGTDPTNAANWQLNGVYTMSAPMGKNAFQRIAGDVLVATITGIIPMSQAVLKDPAALLLAAVTVTIAPLWKQMVAAHNQQPWSIYKWDTNTAMYVTWPGGGAGNWICGVVNTLTGAWTTYTGWDANCFGELRNNLYFGTSNGLVMQGEVTGADAGLVYVASYVGGWEVFGMPPNQCIWRQARVMFTADGNFVPQVTAAVDYNFILPAPPSAIPTVESPDTWDSGDWDVAKWDGVAVASPPLRNTGWTSIGMTGFAHAPIVQVTSGSQRALSIEIVSISAIVERVGVAV